MDTGEITITLALSEEEAALFEGRWAMVVPLSEVEARELRTCVNMTTVALTTFARSLATLTQILESKGTAEPEIRKTLAMSLEPVRKSADMMDRVRELLGRAAFIGSDNNKERLQ